jgi:aspartate-semialdehyde dehydrogenase
MAKPKVGIIGWRGMVGSVLIDRMRVEKDFTYIDPVFFSTSQAGAAGPSIAGAGSTVRDANDLEALADCSMLISAQGGEYTSAVHPKLRAGGWNGYWIDAASALRMEKSSVVVLDPVNLAVMRRAKEQGIRDFIGGNCTVSLMLMAVEGLYRAELVEWITAMTYQSASGAGAQHMRELVEQMGAIHRQAAPVLANPAAGILDLDRQVQMTLASDGFPHAQFGAPVAGSLIPWIDKDLGTGQSREEWKATAESSRILGTEAKPIPVESICVRIGAMRCHSQALTIKLRRDLPLAEIEKMIASANAWVRLVPNTREASIRQLSPAAVSGTLAIAIGRLRKLAMGGEYLSAFTVGDQLLWGAAEPLRRTLRFLLGNLPG